MNLKNILAIFYLSFQYIFMDESFNLDEFYSLMLRPKNICICKAVNEERLVEAIQEGCHNMKSLMFRTNAATGCGSCSMMVRSILIRELKKMDKDEEI